MHQDASDPELVLCDTGHAIPAPGGSAGFRTSAGVSVGETAACPICGAALTDEAAPVPIRWNWLWGAAIVLAVVGYAAFQSPTWTGFFTILAIAAGMAGFVGLLFWATARQERKLGGVIRESGERLGLYYAPVAPERLWGRLGGLSLFRRGHSRKVEHVLQGRIGGAELLLGKLQYTTGSGKNKTTYRLPFVAIFDAARDWPAFEMAPEGVLDRLFDLVRGDDIDFRGNQEDEVFSARYQLRGPDEPSIRRLFGAEVRAWLAARPGWTIESADGHLVMSRGWRPKTFFDWNTSRPASIEEVDELVLDAAELLKRFARYPVPAHQDAHDL